MPEGERPFRQCPDKTRKTGGISPASPEGQPKKRGLGVVELRGMDMVIPQQNICTKVNVMSYYVRIICDVSHKDKDIFPLCGKWPFFLAL